MHHKFERVIMHNSHCLTRYEAHFEFCKALVQNGPALFWGSRESFVR